LPAELTPITRVALDRGWITPAQIDTALTLCGVESI